MIYVATPYSHPELYYRVERYKAALHVMAELVKYRIPAYSPIVHWHPVEVEHKLDLANHELWKWSDCDMMDICTLGLFVRIPGWQTSKGMGHEADYLRHQGKIDHWIDYDPAEIERFARYYPWQKRHHD